MSGPFESLDDLGLALDADAVCVDGVCAVPAPSAGQGVGEELSLGLTEGDAPDGGERVG